MDLGERAIVAFRATVLNLYLNIAVVAAALVLPLYDYMGVAPLTLACVLYGIVVIVVRSLFRAGRMGFAAASRGFVALTWGICMLGLWLGDETVDNKPWQLLVPLAAFTICGAREGAWWAFASFVGAALICVLRETAYAPFAVAVLLIAHATVMVGLFFYTRHSENSLRTIARLSHTDSLTGVYNRQFFDELAQHAFSHARRAQESLAVFMIDIDHFKPFNDTYGHVAGDRALVAVAEVLRRCARRATDHVFRYGGEEFCIFSAGLDAGHAEAMAQRIRTQVRALELTHEGAACAPLSVSIGIALRAPEDDAVAALLQRADEALYRAKSAGRDRVEMAPPAAVADPAVASAKSAPFAAASRSRLPLV